MIIETMVNGNLQDSDPQFNTITQAISQICVCIKEDFKQYLPHIVPQLLKDAAREIDFKIVDADTVPENDDGDDSKLVKMNIQLKGLEGQK